METEYITKVAAIEAALDYRVDVIENDYDKGYQTAVKDIAKGLNTLPAADVRPVVRGRWEWNKHYGLYQCSNCHNSYVDIEWVKEGKWKYCPSCGADMREVKPNGES